MKQEADIEATLHAEARSKGPIHYNNVEWEQSLVQQWCPASSHIFWDRYNARWRIHWRWGDLSRSWGAWGFKESALLCVRAAWTSTAARTGLQCPVPGVFPHADPVPKAAPARGRGGRGRGRGRGRAAAAPPIDAAPAAADAPPIDAAPAAAAAPVAPSSGGEESGADDAGGASSSSDSSSSDSSSSESEP